MTTLADLLLRSPSSHDRCYASLAIGITGHKNPDTARDFWPILRFAYRSAISESERGAHAIAMGLLRDHEALPILREALADKARKDIRPHICTALGLLRDEPSRPLLRKIAVGHEFDDARSAAATASALLCDQDAVGPLIDSLNHYGGPPSLAAVAIGHLADHALYPRIAALATPTPKGNWRAEMARPYALLALGVMGDKDPTPLLSQIRLHSNYLAQCQLLAELFRIL